MLLAAHVILVPTKIDMRLMAMATTKDTMEKCPRADARVVWLKFFSP